MQLRLKCVNGQARLEVPRTGNRVKAPYVSGKIKVDLSQSDFQQKITIRCTSQPKILGTDNKEALVFSHGPLIEVMMTNVASKLKSLTINIKISSSVIKN